ncbi:MAG: hypothetical protein V7733_20390 [Paraglaciecola polaris]|uniref:hypothetical protein n=1 Tax=Paraglaciecola polaris TaxID=222814 RepID=UPI003002FCF8
MSGPKFQVMRLDARSTLGETRLLDHESTPSIGQPTMDKVSFITEDQWRYTKWRSKFSFSLKCKKWSATYSLRYISAADYVNCGNLDPLGKFFDALTYSDIAGS